MKNMILIILVLLTICLSACSKQEQKVQSNSATGVVKNNEGKEDISKETKETEEKPNSYEFVEIVPEIGSVDYYNFNDGVGRFEYKGKVGYVNEDGKVIIEPKYTDGTIFSEGYCIVTKDNFSSYSNNYSMIILDKEGNKVFESDKYGLIFDGLYSKNISVFDNGITVLQTKDGYAIIDVKGNELALFDDSFTPMGQPSEGIIVWSGKGIKLTDYQGNQIGEIIDDFIPSIIRGETFYFEDGLLTLNLKIYEDGESRDGANVINKNGEKILTEDFQKLGKPSNGLIPFSRYDKWGYIDYSGKIVIEPQYDEAGPFSNELAVIKKDGKWGYIDKSNNVIVDSHYILRDFFEIGLGSVIGEFDGKTQTSLIDNKTNVAFSIPIIGEFYNLGDDFVRFKGGSTTRFFKIKLNK